MSRVALITGVLGGIGRSIAEVFHAAGWHVLGADEREMSGPSRGIDRFVRVDVSDPVAVQRLFEEVSEREGRLDALVNTAAVQVCKPLVETSLEDWDRTMAVNLKSVYLTARGAHPLMRGRAGAVVNVSSVHALATSAGIAAYASSKGALLTLTRSLAIEWAGDRIRVNAVLPGAIDTRMLEDGLARGQSEAADGSRKKRLADRHPLGRIGRPEDVAQAVLFLADEQKSSFITGQALVVDGGAMACLSTESQVGGDG